MRAWNIEYEEILWEIPLRQVENQRWLLREARM